MIKKKQKVIVKYRTRKELPRMYQTDDQILPTLVMTNPVNIKVLVNSKNVQLIVGPRDWEWDRKSGEMIGCGTCLDGMPEEKKANITS